VQLKELCPNDFVKLKRSHVDEEDVATEHVWVKQRKIHNPNQASRDTEAEEIFTPVQHDYEMMIWKTVKDTAHFHPFRPLFPHFNSQRISKWVRDAAKHFGWPDELAYDGLHSIRHGSGTDTEEAHGSAAAACQLGHARPAAAPEVSAVTQRYTEPESGRVLRARKNATKQEAVRKVMERTRAAVKKSGNKSRVAAAAGQKAKAAKKTTKKNPKAKKRC